MRCDAETRNKYDSLINSASALYLEKQFQRALAIYNDALKLATDSGMSKVVVSVLKYMICCCLYESKKLEDLAEAVHMLQAMDRSIKNRFPAVYCLLAQTHCKLFRFELAEMEFNNADAVFSKNPTLETFFIPGTDHPIRPTSKDDETWSKIKEECLAYHQPDAICSFPDCNYVAKPYVVPIKYIFLKDPAFNGMVIVNCSNKDQPCVLKFHQYCWKMKKDQLYPLSRVSDKDIIGDQCFTPNCLNGDTFCVISSIQVIDQNGELKAHIKENPSTTWSVKSQDKNDKTTSKGAIKKLKVNPPPKKSENPTSSLQQQLLDSLKIPKDESAANNIQSEDGVHHYDESQIIVVKDAVVDVEFLQDPPEVAGEKSFLHSFFLDYIKKNHVRICDVYSKFNEYNEDLHLKDLDILGFLIQTNNFEILSSKDTTCAVHTEEVVSPPNESFKAKSLNDDTTSYIDDIYYELMNGKDEVYVDCPESTVPVKNSNFNVQDSNDFNINLPNNYQSQYNLNNNSFAYVAPGGGDASEHLKTSVNIFSSRSPTLFKENENMKLKDLITKLESDMEKIIDENSNLRKAIVNKESDVEHLKKECESKDCEIEQLKQERESFEEKMKMVDEMVEGMTNFQKIYTNVQEENVKTKEELLKVMKEKNDLEAKVEKLEDPEAKRAEFMKFFQEEYALLQQSLNEEWESKTDILKKSLKTEIEVKMSLLNKLLNTQFTSQKYLLTRYLEQCSDFVDVTSKVNSWLERTLNVKNFVDNAEWVERLELLQVAASNLQSEYSKLLRDLHAEKEEKYKMTDINLKIAAIPNPPSDKLGDVITNALNTQYRHQCQLMQNYAMKAQAATQAATQAMQYQMHHSTQSQTYNSVPAEYVQQYPNVSPYYSNIRSSLPTTPLVGITPVPTYQMTPRTAGPPPNLTLQQVATAPLPIKTEVSDPVEKEIEKSEPVSFEQSAPTKVDDVLATKDKVKEETKDVKENVVKAAENNAYDDKLAKMRESFKNLALIVKEKSKSDIPAQVEQNVTEKAPEKAVEVEKTEIENASEKVTTPAAKIVNQVKGTVDNVVSVSTTKTETNGYAQSIKDSVSIHDDRSDITTLTTRADSKSQKKVGMDGLVKVLLKKFPGAMECDVIEAIAKIRKERNNALTGVPVSQIIEEAKPHILQSQRLHVIRYFVNDGNK